MPGDHAFTRSDSRLLIDEPPLQVLPTLAVAVGLNEAIVLQQIHYWMQRSDHVEHGRTWVYNTILAWQAQFPFWSTDTIGRAIGRLVERGILIRAQLRASGRDRTNFYTINYAVLAKVEATAKRGSPIPQSAVMENRNLRSSSLEPENTTETTTENTVLASAAPRKTKPDDEVILQAIFSYYRERILPGARTRPDAKIRARLRRWSAEELRMAIEHFAQSEWYMTNCASKGAAWFFDNDSRIESFWAMDPEKEQSNGASRSGGQGFPGAAKNAPRQSARPGERGPDYHPFEPGGY